MQLSNLIFVLATIIPTSYTLKCYQCNSAEVAACADIEANDTSSVFLQECTGSYDGKVPFCRKIVTKVMENNDKRVTRKCSWLLDDNRARVDFCKESDSDFVMKKSCACFTDSCNTGSNFSFNSILLLLMLIFSKLR